MYVCEMTNCVYWYLFIIIIIDWYIYSVVTLIDCVVIDDIVHYLLNYDTLIFDTLFDDDFVLYDDCY